MAMTINTNISSLNAQRNLGTSQSSLSTSMQRLSSGMRINSAKDDAAGLAIAERMGAQITGLNQAQRNANDGVSLAQTAEGALSSIGTNLQRIRELAVQSRNATNSSEDRSALQKEVDQLKSEIDRVAQTTSFNGTKLLDGTFTEKAFQVGANQGELITVPSVANAQITKLGQWESGAKAATAVSYSVDKLNTLDFSQTTRAAAPAVAAESTFTFATGEFDSVAGTFNNAGSMEVNLDGKTVTASWAAGGAAVNFSANAGDLEVGAGKDITAAFDVATGALTLEAVNAGNKTITTTASAAVGTLAVVAAGADAVPARSAGALTVTVGGTSHTINTDYSGNQAGFIKDLQQKLGTDYQVKANGDSGFSIEGTKTGAANTAVISSATAAGLSGIKSVAAKDAVAGSQMTGFSTLDISSVEGADDAILAMDAALKAVNSARADLGAIQNRFESVVSNLSVNSENLSASKSRIMDADFASETANLSRAQVLQQAGTAMVAQANQLPQGVLSLLR